MRRPRQDAQVWFMSDGIGDKRSVKVRAVAIERNFRTCLNQTGANCFFRFDLGGMLRSPFRVEVRNQIAPPPQSAKLDASSARAA